MAINDFFIDKCDIYHLKKTDEPPEYGLPEQISQEYPEIPDEIDVICFFTINKMNLVQEGAGEIWQEEGFFFCPINTPIFLHDRVVNKKNNVAYKCYIPQNIQNNHLKIQITKDAGYDWYGGVGAQKKLKNECVIDQKKLDELKNEKNILAKENEKNIEEIKNLGEQHNVLLNENNILKVKSELLENEKKALEEDLQKNQKRFDRLQGVFEEKKAEFSERMDNLREKKAETIEKIKSECDEKIKRIRGNKEKNED